MEDISLLLVKHREEIKSICLSYAKNLTDAEDLCHDVLLRVLLKRGELKNENAFKIWMIKIAKNICLNHVKKSNKIKFESMCDDFIESPDRDTPESVYREKQRKIALSQAANHLSVNAREVFILRELYGLPYKEIAMRVGVSTGTIMSRLSRSRKEIEKVLKAKNINSIQHTTDNS